MTVLQALQTQGKTISFTTTESTLNPFGSDTTICPVRDLGDGFQVEALATRTGTPMNQTTPETKIAGKYLTAATAIGTMQHALVRKALSAKRDNKLQIDNRKCLIASCIYVPQPQCGPGF